MAFKVWEATQVRTIALAVEYLTDLKKRNEAVITTRRSDEPETALNAAAREEEGGEGERLRKEILRR